MNKKTLVVIIALILLTSMMVTVFVGKLNVVKADNTISDSQDNPNSWPMFHGDLSHTSYS